MSHLLLQPPEEVTLRCPKNDVVKYLIKSVGKHLWGCSIFGPATSSKERLHHRCFPANFAFFFKNTYFGGICERVTSSYLLTRTVWAMRLNNEDTAINYSSSTAILVLCMKCIVGMHEMYCGRTSKCAILFHKVNHFLKYQKHIAKMINLPSINVKKYKSTVKLAQNMRLKFSWISTPYTSTKVFSHILPNSRGMSKIL